MFKKFIFAVNTAHATKFTVHIVQLQKNLPSKFLGNCVCGKYTYK